MAVKNANKELAELSAKVINRSSRKFYNGTVTENVMVPAALLIELQQALSLAIEQNPNYVSGDIRQATARNFS